MLSTLLRMPQPVHAGAKTSAAVCTLSDTHPLSIMDNLFVYYVEISAFRRSRVVRNSVAIQTSLTESTIIFAKKVTDLSIKTVSSMQRFDLNEQAISYGENERNISTRLILSINNLADGTKSWPIPCV